MALKFRFLTGDVNWQEYGGKFISKKLNSGEWDYWMVIEVIPYDEFTSDANYKYGIMLMAVSPEACKNHWDEVCKSWGMSEDEFNELDPIGQVDIIQSYGISALLWQSEGNNLKSLLHEAREEARKSEFLFGFAMDRYQNQIGSTGWDCIAGDILAGLNRSEEDTEE